MMKHIKLFEQFLYEAKDFKVGDKWEWHGVEWDPNARRDYSSVKKVEITKIKPNGEVFGKFEGESEEFIVRDANKYLKKKIK
jgi:hypothetical protein